MIASQLPCQILPRASVRRSTASFKRLRVRSYGFQAVLFLVSPPTSTAKPCERAEFRVSARQPGGPRALALLLATHNVQGVPYIRLAACMYVHGVGQLFAINVRDSRRFDGLRILHPAKSSEAS